MELGGLKLWQWVLLVGIAVVNSFAAGTVASILGSLVGSMLVLYVVARWARQVIGKLTQTKTADSSPQ